MPPESLPSARTRDALQRNLQLHQSGELDAAERGYRALLQTDPALADAWHLLGLIALRRGANNDAVQQIQHAIALNPQDPVYHFNLGNAYRRQCALTKAVESYRTALQLDPNDADALNNLGSTLHETGEIEQAAACYARAHELTPADAQILGNLGAALFELDRLDDAAECFTRAIDIDPEYAEAHNNLGAILQTRGALEPARSAYERAVRAAPEFASAHKNRASVLHLLGHTPDAIAGYREALRLQPDYADAQYELDALLGAAHAAPPPHYVAGLFDQYAHEYDSHMTRVLGYGVPQKLREALAAHRPQRALDILDLGCGTGLSGAVFKDIAHTLTGIDLSPKMIAKARERGIYDELVVGDLLAEIARLSTSFDLVIAADVFVYLGDLRPVFAGVRRVLRPGALFAFSVECSDGDGYTVRDAGRYAHGTPYLRAVAKNHEFIAMQTHDTVLRKDYEREVPGTLWILRR